MKPSIPKGTRDFSAAVVQKRHYIFNTLKQVFEKYGFAPIETPTIENLATLTGKYGDEGDQLLFKILNRGDKLSKNLAKVDSSEDSFVARKSFENQQELALRYDLTIPFARYVAQHRNDIAFPFKRYQIQPVWRADRPQRGRYREFYQCDVDIVGSNSLINEVDLISIYDEGFTALKVPVTIKVNNRKVFQAMSELANIGDNFMPMTIAIDKLDKIGKDGVQTELEKAGINVEAIETIFKFLDCESISELSSLVEENEVGQKGVAELQYIFDKVEQLGFTNDIAFDITLARGLNYYTGCIFEVQAKGVKMGSIGGGGRYDNLTGGFGLKDISGVGVSFGADRIYDVMEELNLFPDFTTSSAQILFISMDESAFDYGFSCVAQLRKEGISSELYPDLAKPKKMFKYADTRQYPFVAILGQEEVTANKVTLKNMSTGEQKLLSVEELIENLK